MNDRTNRLASLLRIMHEADGAAPPPKDELDALLRDWHHEHAEIAAAKRAEILAAIGGQVTRSAPRRELSPRAVLATIGPAVRRALTSQFARAAACIALAALFATITLLPARHGAEAAIINVAEGGELTAFTADGDRLGPCPLQHTDVAAEVSGPVTRVNVRQTYANPYPQKIEATYTFPLSHRAAVDSMRITVRGADGVERIVEGEVRERSQARRMYEDARRAGFVASLLEQERRNIFTQSVANIEPGASVAVDISYVEFLERRDGEYRFAFPMVVAPRYVPGSPNVSGSSLPDGLSNRAGVVLLAPAEVTVTSQNASLTGAALQSMLVAALPVKTPSPEWMERPAAGLGQPIDFIVTYANGSKEPGQLFDGAAVGQVNGRWFFSPTRRSGTGFAADTNQVPDASRITPMPNKPAERAGHEVALSVTIDAGGLALSDVNSELHEIVESTPPNARRRTFELKSKSTIPNRDFVMSWHAKPGDANEIVGSATLAHLRTAPDETAGGYFAVLVEPPARPTVDQVMPRELLFLVDVSGSMQGFPIEKSKEVIGKAIAAMRPADTFNVITFAGNTQSLWSEPRTATDENRRLAREFVERQQGGGGTEMLPAIEAALKGQRDAGWLAFADLLDLPADGRSVRLEVPQSSVDQSKGTISVDGKAARVTFGVQLPSSGASRDLALQLSGRWMTESGERVFVVDSARYAKSSVAPNRIVLFLTDGLIGNDGAIIDLVRQNAKSTRVFAFGIGNSVNRALLEGAATAGRGMAEFVTLPADADAAVARLTRRLESPVLVDIDVAFNNIEVSDVSPALDRLPDLYDESPLVLVGRYVAKPGVAGTLNTPSVTVRGRNANGPWERTIPIDVAGASERNTAIASLWARSKVDAISEGNEQAIAQGSIAAPIRKEMVRLGERYRIMTPFTSFIAIEKSRVTVGGEPMLVQIPIELPEGMSWKGLFGEGVSPAEWAVRAAPADPNLALRRGEALSKLATIVVPANNGPAPLGASEPVTALFFDQQIDEAVVRRVRKSIDQAKSSLEAKNAGAAERESLLAAVQLDSAKDAIDGESYKALKSEITELSDNLALTRVDREAQAARDAKDRLDRVTQSGTNDAKLGSDAFVTSSLKRVRELQLELKYDEALRVLDEVTFVDPENPAVNALKDIISTSQAYRRYGDVEKRRWEAYAAESHKALADMVPPRPNISGSGPRSAAGLFDYPADWPEGWPELTIRREGSADQLFEAEFDALGAEDGVQFPWQVGRSDADGRAGEGTSAGVGGGGMGGAAFGKAMTVPPKREQTSPKPGDSRSFGVPVSPAAAPAPSAGLPGTQDSRSLHSTPPTGAFSPDSEALSRFIAADEAVRAKLQLPISVNFTNNHFADTLNYFSTVTGIPVSVDWQALGREAVRPEDAVTLEMHDAPAKVVLDRILDQIQPEDRQDALRLDVQHGVATLTVAPPAKSAPPRSETGSAAPPAPAEITPPAPAPTADRAPPAPQPTDPAPAADGTKVPVSAPAGPGGATRDAAGALAKEKATSPRPGSKLAQPLREPEPAGDRPIVSGAVDKSAVAEAPLALSGAERDTLARRVQRGLLLVGLAAQIDVELAKELAATSQPSIAVDTEGRVRLTLLLSGEGEAFVRAVTALRDAGATIEDADPRTHVVVARIELKRLIPIGLLEPVRRIEPFRGTPDQRQPHH